MATAPPTASILAAVAAMVPPLRTGGTARKGQCGRVLVVGGSEEYTGAPYYASVAGLKAGADLASIACPPSAATPIKCYSPELVVYPVLPDRPPAPNRLDELDWIISRQHAVVVGPGMGRSWHEQQAVLQAVVQATQTRHQPLILDGDALFFLHNGTGSHATTLAGHPAALVTPNGHEFQRLCDRLVPGMEEDATTSAAAVKVARAMPGVVIVQKGLVDRIVCHPRPDGAAAVTTGGEVAVASMPSTGTIPSAAGSATVVLEVTEPGSPRRCGGQGDILAGVMATFAAWAAAAHAAAPATAPPLHTHLMHAAYAACTVVRRASAMAFAAHGRATTAPDILAQVGPAFRLVFDTTGKPAGDGA